MFWEQNVCLYIRHDRAILFKMFFRCLLSTHLLQRIIGFKLSSMNVSITKQVDDTITNLPYISFTD